MYYHMQIINKHNSSYSLYRRISGNSALTASGILVISNVKGEQVEISQLLQLPSSSSGKERIFTRVIMLLYSQGKAYSLFYLFIYLFWLCWAFVAAHGLSLVVASGGYSSLQCMGFSPRWLLLLRSMGSRHVGCSSCSMRASVVVAHGLSSCGSRALECRLSSCGARLRCSMACGIFPDQGSNLCPLHWQADS